MPGEARPQKRPQKPPAFILTPHSAERLRRRGRRLQRDLDYELVRLRGRKRFGLVWLSLATLAFSLIAVPFFWVMSLAKNGPKASPAMIAEAASSIRVSRSHVPVQEIDPILVLAVVTAIDPAFCADGAVFRQRLAQDVLLWPNAEGREPSFIQRRLARYLAWHINLLWSRPRMVEVYMNSAVWGPGHIGVEAASLARYGLPSRALEARLQAVPLAVAVVEPDLMGEGAAPGALIERVDALAAETEALIAAGAFACLTMQE
ncbi:MAG: transglycosylase domain-containing protein [Alphaproteobacteria bacterium]|jgi:monofunctional biosynthetic peptidoglycan transglycosylase|nr:transglycosylase domain-containing protein [Alphaproteobacteria bacterium]